MLTYLGIAFILALLGLILYGFGFVMRRPSDGSPSDSTKCAICRLPFKRDQLVERQVGDSKLLSFCPSCILNLHDDLPKLPPSRTSA